MKVVALGAALVLLGTSAAQAHRDGSAGVTIALPKTWRSLPIPPAPPGMRVVDPRTRIVAASGPITVRARGCEIAAYAFPRTGVAVVVVEWVGTTPGARWPRQPRRFTSKTLPVRPPPAIECWDGAGGSAEFADHGRRLAAYVLLGPRAPRRLAGTARAVLDTLRVARRR
jgi:hypothetical protein